MGIPNLLFHLTKLAKIKHLESVNIAVDGMSLVYYFHSQQQHCLGNYSVTDKIIKNFLKKCKANNVQLWVFFDGISSSTKSKTLQKRKQSRKTQFNMLDCWACDGMDFPEKVPLPPLMIKLLINILRCYDVHDYRPARFNGLTNMGFLFVCVSVFTYS